MKTKKLLSLLLAIVMLASMMATLTVTVSAADTRSRVIQKPCGAYYCVNGKNKCLTCDGSGKRTCTDCGGTNICPSCQGDETILCWCEQGKCHVCDENGKIDCDLCDATGYKGNCTLCGGDGIIEVDGSLITFDTNGTQIKENLTQPDAVENGENFTAFPVVSAEGKTFLGWSTDKTAKTASYVNGNTYQVFADVTFYAIWKADNECILDLDENTTEILDNKQLDQNYNLTVNEGTKTDATKVKLSWEIKDINATRTDNKVWDTENLCWKTDSSSTTINQVGTAKFTLENYSSVMVDATAKFEALSDTGVTVAFDETTGTDGKITLDTANGNETYSKTNVPSGEITVTVTPSNAFFKDKSATTATVKYGTYTVTIGKSLPTSFVFSGFYDGEANNAKINGMTTSAFCQYMVDNGMIDSASAFGNVLVKSTYYSKLQKKNVTVSKTLSLLFDTTHQEFGAVTSDTLAGDNDYTKDKSFFVYFNGSFTWDGSAFIKNS